MNAATQSELIAILKEARTLQIAVGKLAARLDKAVEASMTVATGADAYKRADGRLTDAGITAVNAAFEAGATVTEVSKQFDIHVSGASNRRKIWLASKAAPRV